MNSWLKRCFDLAVKNEFDILYALVLCFNSGFDFKIDFDLDLRPIFYFHFKT